VTSFKTRLNLVAYRQHVRTNYLTVHHFDGQAIEHPHVGHPTEQPNVPHGFVKFGGKHPLDLAPPWSSFIEVLLRFAMVLLFKLSLLIDFFMMFVFLVVSCFYR